ncbi:MAG: hypothetical protein IT555_19015 [Acetobacteraceae bacterium]|nr:hypothetical protein [Acetobacteraceae bacterium]
MTRDILIGISGGGVLHTDAHVPDVDTQFRMVKESGAFDYFERTPLPGLLDAYKKASQTHGVPLLSGGFFYALGRDEPLLEWHLRIGAECGMRVQNVQVPFRGANGARVTDQQVADFYLWAAELGDRLGVVPCFEVHINMWSERLSRVARVARLVEARGVAFNMTLDHSHVIFKIDNQAELDIEGLREDLAAGLVLQPGKPGNVCAQWIANNWVRHAHARPAVPNNPRNLWAAHPDGSPGRGVQYPFIQPRPGEWHSDWHEAALEPWKDVVRQMFAHHAADPGSRLQQVTVEMIPGIDYGFGHRYSIFDHSVAVAHWLRAEWQRAREID